MGTVRSVMYVKYLKNSYTSSCYTTDKSETREHRAHLPIQRWSALHEKTLKLKSLNTLLNLGSDAIASLPLQVPHPWFPLHCLGFREPQINFSISSHSCPKNISKLTLPQGEETLLLQMLLCQILTNTWNGTGNISWISKRQWRITCLFNPLTKCTQPSFYEVFDPAWYYWCTSPKYSQCPQMIPWDIISLMVPTRQPELLSGIYSTMQKGTRWKNRHF